MSTMSIPRNAVQKLMRVVNQLSYDSVMKRDTDWETVTYFQTMLNIKTTCFILAEIAHELEQDEVRENKDGTATTTTTGRKIRWSKIVKLMETLEDNENNDSIDQQNSTKEQSIRITCPMKLLLLTGLQQDVEDLTCIPRDDTMKLKAFLAIMKEEYMDDVPEIYSLFQKLVKAYQEGTEQDILQQKLFIRARTITKLGKWLMESMRLLNPSNTMTIRDDNDHEHIVVAQAVQQQKMATTTMDSAVTESNDETQATTPTTKNRRSSSSQSSSKKVKKRPRSHDDTVETQGRLKELKTARGRLNQAVDVDPLQEAREVSSLAVAAKATTTASARGEQLYTKKTSAQKLEFSDDDDDDGDDDEYIEENDEDNHATHELSEIPIKLKPPRPPLEQPSQGSPTQDNQRRATISYARWSQEQKMAFLCALRIYGVGNWARIRDAPEYKKYWQNKNNVQLKDLFRTMKAGGKIPNDLLVSQQEHLVNV